MRVRTWPDFRDRIQDDCIHPGLAPDATYFVIEVSGDHYRLVDDGGEPVLYPKHLFEVVDARVPPGWELHEYDDGEYYLKPVGIGAPGFWEDFFFSDGDAVAEIESHRAVRDMLMRTLEWADETDAALIRRDLARLRRPRSASAR